MIDTDLEAELTAERDHMAAARVELGRMRAGTRDLFATGANVAGDAYTAEVLGTSLRTRLRDLADDPSTPLFFGRLNFAEDDPNAGGEDHHIGRRHVVDEGGEPMVLDWRAPLSQAFYRASVRSPLGVELRRRFGFANGLLTSFEDEHLTAGEELGTASRILTSEIERPRVGPMRDIVATIQPEQDELVRMDLEDSICVQGAPGTGKTAVGLHRAAFLLYTFRERLKRSGVLVVGPNKAFLHYIGAVLPALGEVDIDQLTVDDLVAHVPVRATDSVSAATIKHSARMATVLARALSGLIRRPSQAVVVTDGSWRWRVGEEALRRIIDDVRREDLPYATGRERVRARVVALLQRQAEARRAESPSDAWLRRMGKTKSVTEFLDTCWPAVTPAELVASLLSDRSVLAAASSGLLTEEEGDELLWASAPRTLRAARFSAADCVLIDEALGLIERIPSYGHVVVDEAQDLSAMQCRAVARRSEHGSVTVLGDLAQGTSPWAAVSWDDTMSHLGKPGVAATPLTVGFRVPEAVVALANRLLSALDVGVPPATSLRRDGGLAVTAVAALPPAVVTAVREALAHEGSIAVVAADAALPELRAALTAAGIPIADPFEEQAGVRVTALAATLAKGLEYDHVIVAEPGEIVDAEPRGLHRLYVVLTRAVSRLVVLHTRPLPSPLTA